MARNRGECGAARPCRRAQRIRARAGAGHTGQRSAVPGKDLHGRVKISFAGAGGRRISLAIANSRIPNTGGKVVDATLQTALAVGTGRRIHGRSDQDARHIGLQRNRLFAAIVDGRLDFFGENAKVARTTTLQARHNQNVIGFVGYSFDANATGEVVAGALSIKESARSALKAGTAAGKGLEGRPKVRGVGAGRHFEDIARAHRGVPDGWGPVANTRHATRGIALVVVVESGKVGCTATDSSVAGKGEGQLTRVIGRRAGRRRGINNLQLRHNRRCGREARIL